jgi:Flp pilus assembly protein TadG
LQIDVFATGGVGAEQKVIALTLAKLKGWPVRRILSQREEGQSLVEFSLVLPIFLLLVTGIFAFGIAYNNWLVLTDATSVGGRTVAIYRGNTLDPCSTAATAIQGAAPGLNASNITYAFLISGVSYSGSTCSSSSTTTGAAGNMVQGGTITVTTTYPCSLAVYGKNLIPNCTLQASVKELVQ